MTKKCVLSTEQTRIHLGTITDNELDIQKYGLCFLGTFEHRTHHFQEARIFGLFQAALHTILHDRYKFFVAQLVIVWQEYENQELKWR